jgi:hypothetical protein
MSSPIPDTVDGLGDWLAGYLGDSHHQIIGALLRLARDLEGRLAACSVALHPELDRALSLIETWNRGEGAGDILETAYELIEERLDRARAERDRLHRRRRPRPVDDPATAASAIVFSIAHVAYYEDHDDWPQDVVQPAAHLLMRVAGFDERGAAQWAAAHFFPLDGARSGPVAGS